MTLGADVELDASRLRIGQHKMRNYIFSFFLGRKKVMENENAKQKQDP